MKIIKILFKYKLKSHIKMTLKSYNVITYSFLPFRISKLINLFICDTSILNFFFFFIHGHCSMILTLIVKSLCRDTWYIVQAEILSNSIIKMLLRFKRWACWIFVFLRKNLHTGLETNRVGLTHSLTNFTFLTTCVLRYDKER